MGIRKAKSAKQDAFEITPLPPDTYDKPAEWHTPDGKAPVAKPCRVTGCPNKSVSQPPVCDHHFYGLVNQVRNALIQDKARENGNNGR